MKNNRKGFTLAELLIVVAIIAVLVAIAIPTFTSQLEKSREGTDAANIRNMYAEVMTAIQLNDKTEIKDGEYVVNLQQTNTGWQNETIMTQLQELERPCDATKGQMGVTFKDIDKVGNNLGVHFTYVFNETGDEAHQGVGELTITFNGTAATTSNGGNNENP